MSLSIVSVVMFRRLFRKVNDISAVMLVCLLWGQTFWQWSQPKRLLPIIADSLGVNSRFSSMVR